jgi:hypothetical protein
MAQSPLSRVGGQVPGPSLAWIFTGTVLLAGGLWTLLTGFLALYNPDNMLSLSLRFLPTGLPLVCLGSGMLGLGLVKQNATAWQPALPGPPQHGPRLLGLLDGDDTSVPGLVRTSGLGEAEVVRTLAVLEQRGEVQEELNTDTGEYFYRSSQGEGRPLSLQERMDRQEDP